MKYIKQSALLIAQAMFLTALFLFALVLDAGFAVTLDWQFYLVAACFALILVLPSLLSPQRKQALWLFLTFNAALFSLHFIALSPVKPFMQFRRDITPGMSKGEVQHLFIQGFPKGGRFRQPEWGGDDSYLHYTLDPTDGRYNAEWVIVHFKNRGVVKTEYLGD